MPVLKPTSIASTLLNTHESVERMVAPFCVTKKKKKETHIGVILRRDPLHAVHLLALYLLCSGEIASTCCCGQLALSCFLTSETAIMYFPFETFFTHSSQIKCAQIEDCLFALGGNSYNELAVLCRASSKLVLVLYLLVLIHRRPCPPLCLTHPASPPPLPSRVMAVENVQP